MPAFLLASLAAIVLLPLLFWFVLRHIPMHGGFKKWLFAFLSAFCAAVILIPAPNIFIMPMPHLLALIAVAMGGADPGIPGFADIYTVFWMFNVPSFLLTALLFRGLAIFAFGKKPLPKPTEKPI